METLIFYTYEFAASILPFSAAFIFLSHKQKKGGEKTHLLPGLLLFLFAVYIVCVYHVTGTGTLWDAFLYRFQTEISHINPIPFSAGIDMVGYILNIILFIPFGFLIPLIWKKMRSLHLTALAGFSFSILIEISQLLNNRRTDIDDLIMNTLGAIIGFLIYKSFYKPIAKLSDKQLGRLFRAIFKYQLGEEVTVEEDIEMAFGFFINQFEIDEIKYHGIVERNRNNGRKGGAPVGNCNAKSKQPKQPSGLNLTQTTQNKLNDNVNDIDKETTTDVVVKKKAIRNNSPDLSFVDEDFKDLFMEWLEYKRDRKENYKSEKSLKMCYNRLLKLSGNDCNQARLVVEQSIASNYAGLFELKNYGAKTTYSNIYEQNRKDSEQRKLNSVLAVATTVREAAAKKRAELEAEGIIDKIP